MTNSNRFVTGSQTFEITNYSFIKKYITTGQNIRSDSFTVSGHQWAIDFYPNGFNAANADSVSIMLHLRDPKDQHVKALYTHRLKDWSSSTGAWSKNTPTPTSLSTFSATGSTSWGSHNFMKHSALDASCYLQNDTLIIRTTVWVLN